jgi:hydrogen peroxide-dependent heme synthase
VDTNEVTQKIAEINSSIEYTAWTVFNQTKPVANKKESGQQVTEILNKFQKNGIKIRGLYDITAMRQDAGILIWSHGEDPKQIQSMVLEIRSSEFGISSSVSWSAMGIHRPAEFNKSHVPAFMMGAEAKDWLCVYPFVRSYEWYLLPEDERKEMLREHGFKGRDFKGITSNTVSSFGLNDYEWILALESNDLHEIVDMMRELRYTQARRHVREEIPFYTGSKFSFDEIEAKLI